jgi:hypothetical protein
MRGADRRRWESTVAEGQGSGREAVAERSPRQTSDHRNTKRQRGRMRATSVLANAKSKAHQDASSKAAWPGWKAHVLTQGDLLKARVRAGVSRGHSSEDAERKPGGAKGRRNDSKATREPVNRTKCPNVSSPKWGNHITLREPEPPRWCSHPKRQGERHTGQHAEPREEDSDAGDNDGIYHPTSRVNPRFVSNRRMRKTARPVVWEPWRA